MNCRIVLKRNKEESIERLHPWIFSGAIHHIDGTPEEGDVVDVYDAEGKYLCTGHWQIGSIAVRILSFKQTAIEQDFYVKRLAKAFSLRRALGLLREDNDMYRLVHGEGDFLPGLVIDVYGKTAVMQAHSVGMHVQRELVASTLKAVMGDELEAIYYKSETTLPFKAALGQENGFLLGGEMTHEKGMAINNGVSMENGLRFHIDWFKGQKTGFFIDQRDNRALLERYCKGRRVLNMFCYTGGFSVYAMRGGASLVHSVDSSAKAIDLVNANIMLNFPDDARHKSFAVDAFKFLDESATATYDLIILDPPAFAKHRDALRHALKGYAKLNARAMQKIANGGILFTFSCSQAVDKDQFRAAVFTAAKMAGRKVQILHQLHQPTDHPISIYHFEGDYLKGFVLYIE